MPPLGPFTFVPPSLPHPSLFFLVDSLFVHLFSPSLFVRVSHGDSSIPLVVTLLLSATQPPTANPSSALACLTYAPAHQTPRLVPSACFCLHPLPPSRSRPASSLAESECFVHRCRPKFLLSAQTTSHLSVPEFSLRQHTFTLPFVDIPQHANPLALACFRPGSNATDEGARSL